MTIDQYIALGASGAACMSAILALYAIMMAARQQRAAYRPELALSRTIIRSPGDGEKLQPELWTESRHVELTPASDSARRLFVEISNIGLGTANNISVKWSFPIEKAVQEVNDLAGSERVATYERGILTLRGLYTKLDVNG